ncbi:glycine-rich RNA-binding protein 4, mitochondrial-like [Heracleum sosnowskyi]|uniref:Glycine-rich RNA-binding protein 4, mitochondrial-like n=1 Tax=Heracleum sosnowskyi TaxID=360622 RepID=A0AAD8IT78_9APIA|nr:glycine-rich RNA-binding protein 4, mitochondrial-like [Heracleum sosnowskyi]
MKRWNGGIFSSSACTSQLLFSRWIPSRHSSTKLFVGGLSYDTNETVLKDAFDRHGEIIEVKVICDRVSGKSQGYGFVQFTSENAANKALEEMNDKLLDVPQGKWKRKGL